MHRRASGLLFVAALGLLALLGTPTAALPPGTVGDEACAACHGDLLGHYEKTVHAKVLNERSGRTDAMKRGCEACHGPGRAHVEAGGGRAAAGEGWLGFAADSGEDVSRRDAVCLGCHAGGHQRYWEGSVHEQRGFACTSCHVVMRNVSPRHQLAKSDETQTCAQCHLEPRAQIWRNAHMPLRRGPAKRDIGSEGWMSCSSCHNAHGSVSEALIEAISVNDGCYSCHADKRGPFLWEHAPVTESCLGCHDPHGSINPAMLEVSGPRLCQACHNETLHPTDARSASDRFVVGRNCLSCHQKIHGSNHPSGAALTR